MEKKRRERDILRLVYDEAEFLDVREQENPDFVLRRAGSAIGFGVEVTELFETESHARVRVHPRYVSELLAGSSVMHKDDLVNLEVKRVTITNPDGREKAKDVPAIIRPTPTRAAHIMGLHEVLERKDKRIAEYLPGLTHVNLIVLDRFDRDWGPADDIRSEDLLTSEMREALYGTGFREVLFVTHVAPDKRRVVPLRMLLLVSELYLFYGAVAAFESGEEITTSDQLIPAFVDYMRREGRPILLAEIEGSLAAQLGNAAIGLDEHRLRIFDHADFALAEPVAHDVPIDAYLMGKPFREFHRQFASAHTFVSPLAFDVRE
ncbi:MAG: hypothetical protein M3P18_20960 [Actinomycetota bacterium]|nr:hypothetical protein [Actinomycetota bacterium]